MIFEENFKNLEYPKKS